MRNELVLSNTTFQHKYKHITTWQCPENSALKHKNGKPRKNPIRNQIDYILVKNSNMKKVYDSRSLSGTNTNSDHRIVIAKIVAKLPAPKYKKIDAKINFERLQDLEISKQYKNTVQEKLSNLKDDTPAQEKWHEIVKITHETSETVIGKIKHISRRSQNPEVTKLSKEQKELSIKLKSCKDQTKCSIIRKQRNKKLTKIHDILKTENRNKIETEVYEIEKAKSNSAKMFQATRIIQSKSPKIPTSADQLRRRSNNKRTRTGKKHNNIFLKFLWKRTYKRIT